MRIGDVAVARLVSATDVGDAAAQNNLGVVLQRAGRTRDAQHAFDRAVALDGGMSVARRNLRALAPDATATAAARWARVRADATDADAWRALVRHHTARGEFDAAGDVLARWESASAPTSAPAVERARWALEAGRPDDALTAVARARTGAGAHARAGDVALFALLDLLEARAAYQCGDATRALAAVERARAVTPDDAELELLRSFVLGEMGAAEAAAASRVRATTLDPALARIDTGIAALASDAVSGAPSSSAEFEESCTAGRGVFAMATALSHKGYYSEALDALAAASPAADDVEEIARCSAFGVVHLLRGAPHDAIAPLRETLRAVERSGGVTHEHALRLAIAELLAGEVESADARARSIAYGAGAPLAVAGAVNVRALAAWRLDDRATARTYLLDAAAHARGLDDAVRAALAVNLALLLADMGASAGAVAAGAAAARLAPTHAGAHAAHARALAQSGDHPRARAAFARACALAPNDAAARYGLAFAAGACGDRQAARVELARATALSPVVRGLAPLVFLDANGPILLPCDGSGLRVVAAPESGCGEGSGGFAAWPAHDYAHVDARLAAGEYDRALAAAEAALARGASAVDGLTRAGHALVASGRGTAALDRYRQAAAAAPDDPEPELHVVRTMHRLGQSADACARAAAAAARWPDYPLFAAVRARAAADRGAVDDAIDALEHCARVPHHARSSIDPAAFWGDVACAWQALGAWDAAADAWSEASRAAPALPNPPLARARALARAGRVAEADALLQQLAELSPDLPEVWRARAEFATQVGEYRAACAHLARVVGGDAGDVDALAALAAACADALRFDEAGTAVAQAIAVDPEHPLALAVRGDCAAASGDRAGASAAWARALAASPVGAGAARARRGLGASNGGDTGVSHGEAV